MITMFILFMMLLALGAGAVVCVGATAVYLVGLIAVHAVWFAVKLLFSFGIWAVVAAVLAVALLFKVFMSLFAFAVVFAAAFGIIWFVSWLLRPAHSPTHASSTPHESASYESVRRSTPAETRINALRAKFEQLEQRIGRLEQSRRY